MPLPGVFPVRDGRGKRADAVRPLRYQDGAHGGSGCRQARRESRPVGHVGERAGLPDRENDMNRHVLNDITVTLAHILLWLILIAGVSLLAWVIGWLLMARYHYGA